MTWSMGRLPTFSDTSCWVCVLAHCDAFKSGFVAIELVATVASEGEDSVMAASDAG